MRLKIFKQGHTWDNTALKRRSPRINHPHLSLATSMGLSASKRVSQSLNNSSVFGSACDSTYETSLSLAQHAFDGLKPYQLFPATERLYQTLYTDKSLSLISKWVSSPPSHGQVDKAFKLILRRRSNPFQESETDVVLGIAEFREFAVEVFTDAVVSSARAEVFKKVPLGVAGIAGVGMIVRPAKEVVGAAIGVYTLGVTTAVYFGLAV